MAIFVFSADYSKRYSQFCAKHLGAMEKSSDFFQKMVWLIGFGVTVSEISRVQISKKLQGHQKYTETLYSKVNILLIVAFSERAKYDIKIPLTVEMGWVPLPAENIFIAPPPRKIAPTKRQFPY